MLKKNKKPTSATAVPAAVVRVTGSTSSYVSREQALSDLLAIADYFKQMEPQSPLPSMLNRAVVWANLSWSDLMEKVLDNEESLGVVYALTGINAAEEDAIGPSS